MKMLKRTAVMACSVSVALLGTPAQSHAFFHHLFKKSCCAPAAPTTTFSPCNPCATQTVNYVPQTCYRTQYVSVPVTTYRPMTTVDPCTGCPTTCLRPVTSCVQQARLVPYTTYRIAYSNPCPTPCAPAAMTTYAPVAASGCSTCGPSMAGYGAPTAGLTYGAPSYSTPAPTYSTPTYSTPTYSTPTYSAPATTPTYTTPTYSAPATTTPAPSLSPVPSPSSTPSTFQNGTTTETQLKPIPDANINQGSRVDPMSSPRLIDPDSRTTSHPVYRAWTYSPVAWSAPVVQPLATATAQQASAVQPVSASMEIRSTARPVAEDDGWRASSR